MMIGWRLPPESGVCSCVKAGGWQAPCCGLLVSLLLVLLHDLRSTHTKGTDSNLSVFQGTSRCVGSHAGGGQGRKIPRTTSSPVIVDGLSMRASVLLCHVHEPFTASLRHYPHQGMFAMFHTLLKSSNGHVDAFSFLRATFPNTERALGSSNLAPAPMSAFSTQIVSATAGLLWGMGCCD